jgi:AraC family transcriptional regulator of adaptative response / DNA-3-methyladenine glycosylase II
MDLDHDACYRAITLRDARFDGRFFTAVKTTGIYCRPICPARTPRARNVAFYPTAAAAHAAGFRPCLRCRPETAPDLGAWRGTSNTVSRGLALIELGALDEGDLEALAERLGVGERQLRRLFRRHLGAAPLAVAQTRRILLARQLIDETSLPMTEVALAAGFGSVRRFNEAFLAACGRAPSALRRANRSDQGAQAAPEGTVELRLRYQPPYEWPAMLQFHAQRAIPGMECVADGCYFRTFSLDGVKGTVSVRVADAHSLAVTVRVPRFSSLPAIIARVRRVFDLAADPLAIAAHLERDPMLAPLVTIRPGLRVPGAWEGFELAVRAILGQQLAVPAAVRLAGRLVAQYGERLQTSHGALTHLFPKPEAMAGADLSSLGIPRTRALALSALASAVAADPNFLGVHAALEPCIQRLRSLPGVGEWTAQYIALRQLREPDAFPASDRGLMRAFARRRSGAASVAELEARAEYWRPWRAYAAQHLWASAGSAPFREALDCAPTHTA